MACTSNMVSVSSTRVLIPWSGINKTHNRQFNLKNTCKKECYQQKVYDCNEEGSFLQGKLQYHSQGKHKSLWKMLISADRVE